MVYSYLATAVGGAQMAGSFDMSCIAQQQATCLRRSATLTWDTIHRRRQSAVAIAVTFVL